MMSPLRSAAFRRGLSQQQIAEVVWQAAEAAGDDEVEDRAKAAQSAVSAQAKGTNIAGWPRVADLLGNAVADRLSRLCNPGGATDAAMPSYISFGPFMMEADAGLTKEVLTSRGKNSIPEPVWVSAPFEILGQCRDPYGRAWGKLIRFPTLTAAPTSAMSPMRPCMASRARSAPNSPARACGSIARDRGNS